MEKDTLGGSNSVRKGNKDTKVIKCRNPQKAWSGYTGRGWEGSGLGTKGSMVEWGLRLNRSKESGPPKSLISVDAQSSSFLPSDVGFHNVLSRGCCVEWTKLLWNGRHLVVSSKKLAETELGHNRMEQFLACSPSTVNVSFSKSVSSVVQEGNELEIFWQNSLD